ncbi:efflux RND transporter periplasmic adaptor subunit [Roseomonas alkaliterrae]|uniref:HlyD family secretion protein n=1 Tax=Neoroseomonas alkaliterrae TaxID=1452450 RepID=A0A840XP98_9PROT|nr:efflux RND transporter periplasmic adaptor subunit [Neoroseomonas alkaliterrae]MBB5689746.1 HlyD family secretion protein [Neoroseomonas alkaliterrae]MBR0674890.1 efflux RND transporter periplasmic adaptor subunit [Neoroseomonas alkaliterrae]
MRRVVALALLLLAAAAGGWWYATQRPLAVPVAVPANDVPVTVFGLGTVEARILSRVGFEVAGTLTEVLADHGDRIAAGEPLARLNTASQEARLARAEAAMLSAEAQAQRAEAQRERAEALLAQRQATARRRRELANRNVGSLEAAELAETEAAAAQADLAVNRADAAVARALQAEAQANLAAERTALAKHTLRAPYDAIVIARQREAGAAVNPGEAIFTLIAPDSLWALAFVDEGRAGDIALGQPATVTLRSRPGRPVRAEVVRIGLEADRVTEERRVHVRCLACPEMPVIGEQAEVIIETGRLARARLVPENAIHGFDGATGTVWVIEQGRLARRQVRFAARLMDGRAAITDGLPEELPVAIRVGPGFAEGRPARAVPAP